MPIIRHSKQGRAIGADLRTQHTGDGMEDTHWILLGLTAIVLVVSFFRRTGFIQERLTGAVVSKLDKILLFTTIAVFCLTAYVALAH